jgi:hypothetical protein
MSHRARTQSSPPPHPFRSVSYGRAADADSCQNGSMAVGRAERRTEREPRIVAVFGIDQAILALDLFDLTELAWHDCYGEVTPPPSVIEDMLTLSGGTIAGLIQAALLAVTDWRDLNVAAEERRNHPKS